MGQPDIVIELHRCAYLLGGMSVKKEGPGDAILDPDLVFVPSFSACLCGGSRPTPYKGALQRFRKH